jgi:hypothetical protein
MHFIQARLSAERGPGEPRTVVAVADDGRITFTVGAAVWHHNPERLRTVLDRYGREVRLGSHGVLRVPNGHGDYCFSVAGEPDSCRSDTTDVRPGESVIEELFRRGGVVRSGCSVLDESDDSRTSGHR